jgi:type I restriction enzyme, S subunit
MTNDMNGLHDLPEGWVWTTIGNLAESMKNGIYKPREAYSDEGVACLRMYNIESGAIVWKDIKRMILTQAEIDDYTLMPNDILVNRVNSRELVGKSAVITDGLEKCVFESKNIRLRLKHDIADSKFANYWLLISSREYFNRNAQQTVGMASINQEQLGSLPIPLAPLPEQQRIVTEIEKQFTRLEAGIGALKRAQANLKRYKAAVLKAACEGKLVEQDPSDEPAAELLVRILAERRAKWEADLRAKGKDPKKAKYEEPKSPDLDELPELPSGWCWAKVAHVASKVTDGVHQTPKYVEEGIPFISVNNISEDGLISFDPCKYITLEAHEELYTRCDPRRGDVLLSKVGTIGLTAVIDTDRVFSLYVNTALIRPIADVVLAEYAAIALRYGFLSKFYEPFVSGSNQKFIGTTKIAELPAPLPPFAEQRRIVAEVERRLSVVQELDATLTANLARAERLRQAILKRAFEGKL